MYVPKKQLNLNGDVAMTADVTFVNLPTLCCEHVTKTEIHDAR